MKCNMNEWLVIQEGVYFWNKITKNQKKNQFYNFEKVFQSSKYTTAQYFFRLRNLCKWFFFLAIFFLFLSQSANSETLTYTLGTSFWAHAMPNLGKSARFQGIMNWINIWYNHIRNSLRIWKIIFVFFFNEKEYSAPWFHTNMIHIHWYTSCWIFLLEPEGLDWL